MEGRASCRTAGVAGVLENDRHVDVALAAALRVGKCGSKRSRRDELTIASAVANDKVDAGVVERQASSRVRLIPSANDTTRG